MLITSSHTPNCLRQIALAFLFLILFSCVRNQKLLFLFQSFKKRGFVPTRLCLFRCLSVIALAVDHVIILFRRNLHCTQVLAVLQVFHTIFFDTEQPCSRPRFRRRLRGDSAHRNTDSPREQGTFLQPLSLCSFLQFSPILLDKSIRAYKNRATGVNVVSVGSPSRILIVRRISFGMTTLPSSSMRRTIPVAFIYNSPVNVIFGIRRIMRRNTLKKVFREYYLHNALIYSRFCDKNHSTSPFHKRCRKDT